LLQADSSWNIDQVKEQFIKLTKLYHPDNRNTGSTTKFIAIRQAFEEIENTF